ncbi:hypothetical protein ACFSSA_04030 [Luteolibacter algae]|uniref:Squalene cyclase C-terminal domain-containing protein n=1 Tax=Luteolibacter algae TaxID=454151 RepID=A0ABW5D4S5_9BACT
MFFSDLISHKLGAMLTACLMVFPMACAEEIPAGKLKPVTTAEIDAAVKRGIDFLVVDQNSNGSWGSATHTKDINIYAPLPGAHHAYRAGASGLALSGLIDSADKRPSTIASIEKASAWMEENLPKLRRADQTTTYNIWGHAYGTRALTRLYLRENDALKKARYKALAQEQINLVNRYEDINGGFGYLDVFDGFTSKRPTGITTSFGSATVLLAMKEASDTMACTLDKKVVGTSLDSIKRQQFPDKSYAYSHEHIMRPRLPINRPAGSLARSQACNAALRAYGREGISDDVITEWADRFLAREGWLSIARKRPMPHDIHFQISGYFYYYGIYYFTESARFLPPEKQKQYAQELATLILSKQEKDGSWWDYPLYDYHQPYGTGYALMALAWCKSAMLDH